MTGSEQVMASRKIIAEFETLSGKKLNDHKCTRKFYSACINDLQARTDWPAKVCQGLVNRVYGGY
jgi:hypothetical protein